MTKETDKNNRFEIEGKIDAGDVNGVIYYLALMLVDDVIPALDRISLQVADLRKYVQGSNKALAQIDAIYEHLQGLVPPEKRGEIAGQRHALQEALRKTIGTTGKRSEAQ